MIDKGGRVDPRNELTAIPSSKKDDQTLLRQLSGRILPAT